MLLFKFATLSWSSFTFWSEELIEVEPSSIFEMT